MKQEDLFEAIGEIDPAQVRGAGQAKRRFAWQRAAALAACLVLIAAAVVIPLLQSRGGQPLSGVITLRAGCPASVASGMSAAEFIEGDGHYRWWQDRIETVKAARAKQPELTDYYTSVLPNTLGKAEGNAVISPLNTYLAFSMLAESAGGETRRQLLDLLGAEDLTALRKTASTLWQANYVDTPLVKSLLANAVWLRIDGRYDESVLQTLANTYYASSFRGEQGSAEMDRALRDWTDENTGGLLEEYAETLHLERRTAMALTSAIWFKAMWAEPFQARSTTSAVFHGASRNSDVQMMRKDETMRFYQDDAFTAVSLSMTDSGSMTFFLPAEGTDPSALLSLPQLMEVAQFSTEEGWHSGMVHLGVPRFSVSGQTDLLDCLRALGVTDALDPALADFTPLVSTEEPLYLGAANHAALVEVDEEGVTGAAYTDLMGEAGEPLSQDELDFILDRPFVFLLTGQDGSILFAGIVRDL